MQIVVDSLLTGYHVTGKGRVVVLLHGWGDKSSSFEGLQKSLSQKFQVIGLDLPGFGGTDAPQGVWGLSDYAQFVSHFLKKAGIKNVYGFVTHSNGGAIAIRGLAMGVLDADKLVLMSSAGLRGEYKGRVKAIRIVTKLGKALTKPLPSKAKRRLRKKVYSAVGSDMLIAEHMQDTFKKIITDDVRADASSLSIPSLLIYGRDDTATPPSFGRQLNELIKGSKFLVVDNAEHFVFIDKPQTVSDSIMEFLS